MRRVVGIGAELRLTEAEVDFVEDRVADCTFLALDWPTENEVLAIVVKRKDE